MTSNHYCMTSNHVPLISVSRWHSGWHLWWHSGWHLGWQYGWHSWWHSGWHLEMGFQGGFQGWLWRGLVRVLLPRSRSGPGQVQVNFNSGLILLYFSRAWLWSRTTCLLFTAHSDLTSASPPPSRPLGQCSQWPGTPSCPPPCPARCSAGCRTGWPGQRSSDQGEMFHI